MTSFHARRATANDLDGLRKLCAESTSNRSTLGAARKERLEPLDWINARVPVAVVEESGHLVAFAAAFQQNVPAGASKCAEMLLFVTAAQRRKGAGRAVLGELLMIARSTGLWKLMTFALPEDTGSRLLLARMDFREVGVMVKHVQLEGGWHDVAMYERLVMAARKSMPSSSEI